MFAIEVDSKQVVVRMDKKEEVAIHNNNPAAAKDMSLVHNLPVHNIPLHSNLHITAVVEQEVNTLDETILYPLVNKLLLVKSLRDRLFHRRQLHHASDIFDTSLNNYLVMNQ